MTPGTIGGESTLGSFLMATSRKFGHSTECGLIVDHTCKAFVASPTIYGDVADVTLPTMSMYLLMLSYVVAMDDLVLTLMAFRSCSSTKSVASCTKSSSPILKKETRKKEGA